MTCGLREQRPDGELLQLLEAAVAAVGMAAHDGSCKDHVDPKALAMWGSRGWQHRRCAQRAPRVGTPPLCQIKRL
eukprot:SAG22_NODE_166_length_16765_cov_30.782791_10_plen_75_part_00